MLSELPYVADEDARTTLLTFFLFANSRILRVPLALTLKPPIGSDSNCGGDVVAARWNMPSNSSSISREEIIPKTYSNLYPITKMIDEYLARYYSVRKEVECIPLRYFNTYGIGENSKAQYASVVWRFITELQNGNTPVIFGNGEQSRDFIYVEDTARASVLAMERGIPGESYNIGTGTTTNFNDIYRMVAEEMHSEVQADHILNPLKNYQYFTQADITKARKDLGFEPELNLRSGIRKMIAATKSI